MIPQATEQTIKAAAKIYDVVSDAVTLKRSGSGYVGLCPFHDEKTPSFNVSPAKNMCKCFGCGASGDAVWFVMKHLSKTYPEALEYLAQLYKIQIDSTGSKPKKDFTPPPRPAPPPTPPPSYIPKKDMVASLKLYERNNFAKFLNSRFGAAIASELIGAYFVGTAEKWTGANVFWQIDFEGRVRSGKVMVYHVSTGRRDRSKLPNGRERTTWAHTSLKLKDFVLSQCLFGEHLLTKRPTAPVCIVESEKTAILASAYLPESIWLASGGKDGLKPDKFAALKGRNVTLWPDAGLPDANGKTAFQLWSDKAAELNKAGYLVTVSNLIESAATDDERANGFDLADYLPRFDLAEFKAAQDVPESPTPPDVTEDERGYPATWDEPTPPQPSRLEAAAAIMAAHGWTAGRVQAYTAQDEQDRPRQKANAQRLADWTDYKAGIGPNPYASQSN